MTASVFLSHNRADKSFARRLASDLQRAGATVWFDEAEIELGDSLQEKISTGIDNTDYLAVVLSPDSVRSSWVQREVEIAVNREIEGKRIHVLPLLYRECPMPSFLKGKLYADFREEANYVEALNLIKKRLGLPLTLTGPVDAGPGLDFLLHDLSRFTSMISIYANKARERAEKAGIKQPELEALTSITLHQSVVLRQFNALRLFREGRYPIIKQQGRLKESLRRIVSMLGPSAANRKIAFDTEMLIPPPTVEYDTSLMEVALFNLLDNAVKYSYPKTVVWIREALRDVFYEVVVENQGLPIAKEQESRIFSAGYRSEEAAMVTGEGTGYGLYIVNMVASAHGGTVSVNTSNGITRFTMALPTQY